MDIQEIERNIEDSVSLLKALSNEKRLTIICALHRGEKNVGELESIVGLSQPAISQHLARLRRDGLVRTRHYRQAVYYSVESRAVDAVLRFLYDIYAPRRDDPS